MLNVILTVAVLFALSILVAAVLYFPKLKQIFACAKKPIHLIASTKRKIAVVVPARNESKTIGALFDSVMRQDYPSDKFTVNVIVKDEQDATCEMAKSIGAKVFVVKDQTCKGEALDGYFQSLTEEQRNQYSAFVIVDADAVLADDYISQLNNALEYNKQVYVTNKRVKNFLNKGKAHTWVTDCSALVYPILDELGNVYRGEHNMPLNLCGQGLMVTADVINTLGGWPYRSLTEDYELKLDGFLHDFSMMYYPYATIYTEEVLRHKDSYIRRLRWLKGHAQCEKKYNDAVCRKLRQDNCSRDTRYDLVGYKNPFAVYMCGVVLSVLFGIACSIYCGILHLPYVWLSMALLVLVPIALTYVLVFIYCAIAMACCKEGLVGFSVIRIVKTLFIAPLFVMEFIPMYIQCRLIPNKNIVWNETARVNYSSKI